MLTVAMANRGWSYGFNYTFFPPIPKHGSHDNNLNPPNNITVGGSDNWHFGFNYSVWAFQNSPFYVNDTLVFKYDPPSAKVFPHSV
ncbi:hypothetical protein Patl1_36199 [Pistacia atlantica]|nr:hypothetical protein Patl1_36199 [Pistacia atlantica]